ncbi:MAG: GlsB/YeaQ/YmgE family stress response membrane protein [Planctomycetota bacterium]
METTTLVASAEQWAHDLLVWIGFGTLVGLMARAIMPGRDPGGAIATLVMGICGVVVGCGTLAFFLDGHRVSPLSPLGLAVATLGSSIILFLHRLLAGRVVVEGEPRRRTYRRTRRYTAAE